MHSFDKLKQSFAGAILMAVGLLTGLLGCTGRISEPWQSCTYHVTSSVMTEGCHFQLSRDADCITLSGYCYDAGTEYRLESPKQLSQEAANAIDAMALDKAAAARSRLFGMADGRQVTVTLDYPGGKERKISLSSQQQEQLFQLLKEELIGK